MILHRKGTYGVEIFDGKKLSVGSQYLDIIPKKMDGLVILFLATSAAGRLAYVYFQQDQNQKPVNITFGVVDLGSLATIFVKEEIEYGYFTGL